MMRLLKHLCSCLAVLALGASAYAQPADLRPQDLISTYSQAAKYSGSSITIESEGRFHMTISDCTQEWFQAGTYTFKDGAITLSTTTSTVKSHGESDDLAKNLLDPSVYKEQFHEEMPLQTRKEELIPVTWGDRLYLIDRDYLLEFCNAINLGLEPRRERAEDWFLGSFYLRDGDEDKAVAEHPRLSQQLLDLLLKRPIEAAIVNIEFEGKKRFAVINKGSASGLKPGMRLVLADQEDFFATPSLWSGFVVVSVKHDLARLEMFSEADIGSRLSSKFVDRRFQ